MIQVSEFQNKAQTGFEPVIFGLRDRRLTTWPLRLWHAKKMNTLYVRKQKNIFKRAKIIKRKQICTVLSSEKSPR